MPSFVPDSITHVPLFNANVSTIQRYNVGAKIGRKVLDFGRPMSSWYARLLFPSSG